MGPIVEPVQTAPVRPSNIESRPLAGAPIGPTSGAPSTPVRTEPSAAKRPYSDQLLAQMRKSGSKVEASSSSPSTATPSPAPTPAPGASQPSARGFVWPSSGQVIQRFGNSGSTGLSIAGNAGDPVVAAADGRVIFSGRGPRGYGNLVIVKHDSDLLSVYGHNRNLLVKEGASVKRGQRIAELGDSDADRPKLHFEIRKDSKPVDPAQYLPAR
jgi:lipoprotein NlpD